MILTKNGWKKNAKTWNGERKGEVEEKKNKGFRLRIKNTVDNMKTSTQAARPDINRPQVSWGAKGIVCSFNLLFFCAPTAAMRPLKAYSI